MSLVTHSTYFSKEKFAYNEVLFGGQYLGVVEGDLNAWMGSAVNELVSNAPNLNYYLVDNGKIDNGKKLKAICEYMSCLSHLKTAIRASFLIDKRKNRYGGRLCMVSCSLVLNDEHFSVLTMHTSVCISDNGASSGPQKIIGSLRRLLVASEELGSYSQYDPSPKHLCFKAVMMQLLEQEIFNDSAITNYLTNTCYSRKHAV